MNDGVVFLPSFHEAIKDFPDGDRLQMYDAIICYGLYGEMPNLNPVLRSLFALVKPVIDSSQNRHRAAKENGKKGGRPKNQRKNQTENQSKNQTKNQDIDIDTDTDIDTDSKKEKSADKPHNSPQKKKYGEYGWIRLSDDQYTGLLRDLGKEELARCIQYVDEAAQQTGNKNRWRDWNLVLRKCHKGQWGKSEDNWKNGAVKAWNGNG